MIKEGLNKVKRFIRDKHDKVLSNLDEKYDMHQFDKAIKHGNKDAEFIKNDYLNNKEKYIKNTTDKEKNVSPSETGDFFSDSDKVDREVSRTKDHGSRENRYTHVKSELLTKDKVNKLYKAKSLKDKYENDPYWYKKAEHIDEKGNVDQYNAGKGKARDFTTKSLEGQVRNIERKVKGPVKKFVRHPATKVVGGVGVVEAGRELLDDDED